ncbi:hypothetical protein HK101_006880 [Irineochytrium annulatum]|nr:hypothetical protein HK101_006880 [Irineochytrium annulatum]
MILSTLLPTFGVSLAWNTVGFCISAPFKNEKYYDSFGTSTFLLCSAFTLVRAHPTLLSLSTLPHPRQLILLATTTLWAGRLFAFLSKRVHMLKGDRRFDKIKHNPLRFGAAWFIQSIWAGVVGLPAYAVLSKVGEQPALGWLDAVGLGLWVIGFTFETIADFHKLAWQKQHGDDRFKMFISSGPWKYCRYPNYFGEITLWFGAYFVSLSAFPGSLEAKYVLAVSPLFTTLILTKLSGIPLQERQAKKRFEGNKEYEAYTKRTNLIVPWFPKQQYKKD